MQPKTAYSAPLIYRRAKGQAKYIQYINEVVPYIRVLSHIICCNCSGEAHNLRAEAAFSRSISFVIPGTSLYRGSLYRDFTVISTRWLDSDQLQLLNTGNKISQSESFSNRFKCEAGSKRGKKRGSKSAYLVVCYTAVFSVVTQRSSSLTTV